MVLRFIRVQLILAIALAVTPASAGDMTAGGGLKLPIAPDHIRGLVVPLLHARLSSRLQATIEQIGPETGEAFKAGDTLVQFDCTSFVADRQRVEAEAEAATASLAVKRELAKNGAASRLQVQLAEAELKRTRAQVDVASKQVTDCGIRAPYDGRVVERIANAHETVGFRDPLIEIVSDKAVELRVYIPSYALRTIRIGSHLDVTLDETGEDLPARVIAIGARIDSVSQLVELRAAFAGETARLIPGMSGNVRFLEAIAAVTPGTP